MNNLVSRHIVIYDLPIADDVMILRAEQSILRFGEAGTVDIGALCYSIRDNDTKRSVNKGRKVDLSTLNERRCTKIKEFVVFTSEYYKSSGKRPSTLRVRFSDFVVFMNWADSNGHEDVLEGEIPARVAIKNFIAYQSERLMQNQISSKAAVTLQYSIMTLLGNFLCVDDLMRGVKLNQIIDEQREPTSVPSIDARSKVLAMCGSLFDGLSELVLKQRRYPFRLSMPRYLGWDNDLLWVFPHCKWCCPPHHQLQRYAVYNYKEGKIFRFKEIRHLYSHDCHARFAIQTAKRGIENANNNQRHYARIKAALLAQSAFILMFMANLGINSAQLFDTPWNGEYEYTVERQGFRILKWRAGGKACYFEITSAFLPTFKLYLKLREYLLNGEQFGYLFFSLGTYGLKSPKKMSGYMIESLYTILLKLDPSIKVVKSRGWRVAKTDWLLRKADPATASMIMQNTERTMQKHYTAGSESTHLEEMSNFFDGILETVVNRNVPIEGTERAVGTCVAFGTPQVNFVNSGVTPDCRDPKGCLFCDKFRVHVDETDTRKLLSCRMCVQQMSSLALSDEHYQSIFIPILDRTQYLLDEIKRRDASLVDRVKHEVEDEGELDKYWGAKMEMLIELELIA